jgi:hypothetical protein
MRFWFILFRPTLEDRRNFTAGAFSNRYFPQAMSSFLWYVALKICAADVNGGLFSHALFLLLSVVHYATALQLTNLSFWHAPDGQTLKPVPGDVYFCIHEC